MKIARAFEFTVLFFGIPTLYAYDLLPLNLILLICLTAAGCLSFLLSDKTFERRRFWNAGAVRPRMKRILVAFAIVILSSGSEGFQDQQVTFVT